jgi:redox-sensitive bicupin YhaK (pirin superfamily)
VNAKIKDDITHVQYLDVALDAGQVFEHELANELQGFIYTFEGQVEVEGQQVPEHSFAVLADGERLTIKANNGPARFIMVAGKPVGEPIVQYGPFVMNSEEEIHQAMADYRDGKLVQQKAAMVTE